MYRDLPLNESEADDHADSAISPLELESGNGHEAPNGFVSDHDDNDESFLDGSMKRMSVGEVASLQAQDRDCLPLYACGIVTLFFLAAAILVVPSSSSNHHPLLAGTCPLETLGPNRTFAGLVRSVNRTMDYDAAHRCVAGHATPCVCPNRLAPRIPDNTEDHPDWQSLWQRAATLHQQAIANLPADNKLDVVFVGDSITEYWNGTNFGEPVKEYMGNRHVFRSLFDPTSSPTAQLAGLPLGIAGDQIPHLLYRLREGGEMDSVLQPAVWWVLIGTNDRAEPWECNNDQIIAGVIGIVREILHNRPNATVVINSLLPRGESDRLEYWYDGLYPINQALACYAAQHSNIEFFNATSIFLTDDQAGVNQTLLPDGLHPQALGSRLWGNAIVQRLEQLLPQFHHSKKNKNKNL